MPWETLESNAEFKNKNLNVVTERVRTPTHEKEWVTVRRKKAVVIAAQTTEGRFVLVEQERIPVRATIWEMPAGQIDDEKEDAADVARRELREETGYELSPGGEVTSLGEFFASPGFTDESATLFLVRPVRRTTEPQNEDAILGSREFASAELEQSIANGTIRDANTLSTWARLRAKKLID